MCGRSGFSLKHLPRSRKSPRMRCTAGQRGRKRPKDVPFSTVQSENEPDGIRMSPGRICDRAGQGDRTERNGAKANASALRRRRQHCPRTVVEDDWGSDSASQRETEVKVGCAAELRWIKNDYTEEFTFLSSVGDTFQQNKVIFLKFESNISLCSPNGNFSLNHTLNTGVADDGRKSDEMN